MVAVVAIAITAVMSLQTHIIPSADDVDPDVLTNMTSLGCFKDKEKLLRDLLCAKWVQHIFHTTIPKSVLYLSFRLFCRICRSSDSSLSSPPTVITLKKLYISCCWIEKGVDHALRTKPNPSSETDPNPVSVGTRQVTAMTSHGSGQCRHVQSDWPSADQLIVCVPSSADPPRKRVDVRPGSAPRHTAEMLADGSPIAPRRFPYGLAYIWCKESIYFPNFLQSIYRINSSTKVYINCTPNHRRSANRRTNCATNNLLVSPINSPKAHRTTNNSDDMLETPPGSPLSQPYWKSRLNTLKNSFLGSPRYVTPDHHILDPL